MCSTPTPIRNRIIIPNRMICISILMCFNSIKFTLKFDSFVSQSMHFGATTFRKEQKCITIIVNIVIKNWWFSIYWNRNLLSVQTLLLLLFHFWNLISCFLHHKNNWRMKRVRQPNANLNILTRKPVCIYLWYKVIDSFNQKIQFKEQNKNPI